MSGIDPNYQAGFNAGAQNCCVMMAAGLFTLFCLILLQGMLK